VEAPPGREVGVEFATSAKYTGTAYLDAIGW
jgi:hypothetical protein